MQTLEHPLIGKRLNLQRFRLRLQDHSLEAIKPLLLWIEITSRCNLKCIKCGHSFAPPSNADIDSRDLSFGMLETLDTFFADAVQVRTFGYGEMFLYAGLRQLVERLKRYACVVDGVTNGVLIGKTEADWLVENSFDLLTFSIDGVRPETMTRLRGVNVERLFQMLAYFRDRKRQSGVDRPRIVVNFVAEASNIHELPDLALKLSSLGIHFLGVNPLYKPGPEWKGGTYEELYRVSSLRNLPRCDVEQALSKAREIALGAGYSFDSYLDLDAEYQKTNELIEIAPAAGESNLPATLTDNLDKTAPLLPPHYCLYPWLALYVHADSNVRMCCYMQGSIGLARNGDELSAIWDGKVANEIREAVANGVVHAKCAGCVERGYYRHSEGDFRAVENVLG
jgi:MoaA/NifB/PqqE/SkfB family radical SAM enzyme